MRIRAKVAAVTVVVAALAVPVVRTLGLGAHPTPQLPMVVQGHGNAGCRQVQHGNGWGTLVDVREISGAITAPWLRAVRSGIDPTPYAGSASTTVCVLSDRGREFTVVLLVAGIRPIIESRGDYDTVRKNVTPLLARLKGPATTSAPFACPAPTAGLPRDVSPRLPTGATAVRMCDEGGHWFVPKRPLTTGADVMVRAVNASIIDYEPGNTGCSGDAGGHSYAFVFRYPTGTRTVSLTSCNELDLGSVIRGGPAHLDQTFFSLLKGEARPVRSAPPRCPSPHQASEGVGDMAHLVAARFCPARSSGPGLVLTPSELAVLQQWGGSTFGMTSGVACTPTSSAARLSLLDDWGHGFTAVVCPSRNFLGLRVQSSDGTPPTFRPVMVDGYVRNLVRHLEAIAVARNAGPARAGSTS